MRGNIAIVLALYLGSGTLAWGAEEGCRSSHPPPSSSSSVTSGATGSDIKLGVGIQASPEVIDALLVAGCWSSSADDDIGGERIPAELARRLVQNCAAATR